MCIQCIQTCILPFLILSMIFLCSLDFSPIPPPIANTASPSAATPSGCATTSPSPAVVDVASSESSLPPPSSQVERTAEDIARMEKGFNDLVEMAESSFIKNQVSVENIKKSIKRIPLTLKSILGDSFRDQALSFLESKRIEQLFIQLSYFWDYLNPGLPLKEGRACMFFLFCFVFHVG